MPLVLTLCETRRNIKVLVARLDCKERPYGKTSKGSQGWGGVENKQQPSKEQFFEDTPGRVDEGARKAPLVARQEDSSAMGVIFESNCLP